MSDVIIEVREDGETYVVTSDVGYQSVNKRVTTLEGELDNQIATKWNDLETKAEDWLTNLKVSIVGNEVVSTLPETGEAGILYFIPNGNNTAYTQYVYANGQWVELQTIDFSSYVPVTRTVNGQALSADITLTENNIGGSTTTASGEHAMAIGISTEATGTAAFASGFNTHATGEKAHAEGNATYATAEASHSEGLMTNAEGSAAHAEGKSSYALGTASHAEGKGASTNSSYSHAEGDGTNVELNAEAAHAEGKGTIAAYPAQHVQGTYNVKNSSDSTTQFLDIIGNGTSGGSRSNASAIDKDGNLYLGGAVYINCDSNSQNGQKLALDLDADTIVSLIKDDLYKKIYPVGSVFMTKDYSFNPATAFGGTWKQITDDVYLKAVVEESAGGVIGGTTNHTITSSNLPNHTHSYSHSHNMATGKYLISSAKAWTWETFGGTLSGNGYKLPMVKTGGDTANREWTDSYSGNTGNGNFDNSAYYPGYYGVYVWERTE